MLPQSINDVYLHMRTRDRMTCIVIADIVIIQCILVLVGSITILICVWKPDTCAWDFNKLARIMYLFDYEACAYKLRVSKGPPIIKFNNNTRDLDILPIPWMKTITTVTTRLSAKTRLYVAISLTFHCCWFIISVVLRVFAKNSTDAHYLKFVLAVFFYSCIFMILFDVSMSLVYISHIKQSLSTGMVLRYSGWGSTLRLTSYEDFAGWLPIAASICWMRGFIIFLINIYCCRTIKLIRKQIRRREIKRKYENERYTVIPEAQHIQLLLQQKALVYRTGVMKPNLFPN